MSKPETEKILGIDLGTTNSAAAIMEAGRPLVIPSGEGQTASGKMFPSVVAFTKDGQMIVGEPAKRQAATNSTEKNTLPNKYPLSYSRRSSGTLKHFSDDR